MGAYHASELAYVFDASWVLADAGRFTRAQAELSRRIMDAWGHFARGETPSPAWAAIGGGEAPVLELQPGGDKPSLSFSSRHDCGFWRNLPAR